MAEEFKPCPNTDKNNAFCTCGNTNCPRHGICCQCIAFHLPQKQLPQCYRKAGL